MALTGTVEIDGKKQSVQGDKIELNLSPDVADSASRGGSPTTVKDTMSMSGGILVTSHSVTQDGRTTTTTTTTNTNDNSSTTTTTTTDGNGTTTDVKIKHK
jgi:hypothetical protein